MRTTSLAAAILAVATCTGLLAQAPRERHVYVGVTTSNGTPVPGLTPKDFVVKEDDRIREVIRVGTAPPPSHVAILVDTSQSTTMMMADIRDGVAAFVQRLAALEPAPAISIVSFGERPTVESDFTTSLPMVARAVVGLIPRQGSGAYLLDAIIETTKALKKVQATQPAIVAFALDDSTEFSDMRAERVADALRDAGASLWAVKLGSGVVPDSTDGRERERVLGDVTKNSGGMSRPTLSRSGIDAAFTAVASALLTRYDVVYGRPGSLVPPSRLTVEGRERGWRIAAPHWTGE